MSGTPHPFLLELLAERDWNCPDCDYSLLGCRSDRCPECGTPLDIEALIISADRPRNRRAAWRIAILAALFVGFCFLSHLAIAADNNNFDSKGSPTFFMWLFRLALGAGCFISICFELFLIARRGQPRPLDMRILFWSLIAGFFFASMLALLFVIP